MQATITPKTGQLPCLTAPQIEYKTEYQGTINYIAQKDKTKLELAQYLHTCAFSLVVKTLQACVRRGNFYHAGNRRIKLQVNTLNFNGYS